MRRYISLLLLFVLISLMLYGCAGNKASEPISDTRLLLDTVCTITIYGTQDRTLLKQALDLCEKYDSMFSITTEGSDVWSINHAKGAPVTVSPQTAEVIRTACKYAELSGGMFDITIGRCSTLWDFTGKSGIPDEKELSRALVTVDYRNIMISGNTVQLTDPETWIDLGGIAKGYIADKLAEFLKEKGIKGAVIDLGGNIVVVGKKPNRKPWQVGVTKPFGKRSELLGALETGEASVVSSGIYERQFVENGIRYHHILDPNTGMPVRTNIVGTTVITTSSMDGDALSTIILLLGYKAQDGTQLNSGTTITSILDQYPGFIGAIFVLDSGEIVQHGKINFVELN